ncbi:hypothetical protein D6777_02440 [Candidatus Woesearchaeota archaeon]|nr:MAG: hypothetical protein D6777_02440 [Candidatus Woesearchaeota archaeon]
MENLPEIYKLLVENCFLEQSKLEKYLSYYSRLPNRLKSVAKPLSRSEYGEFMTLQREILELRIEAGDERAVEQKKEFERRLKYVLSEQEMFFIGYL